MAKRLPKPFKRPSIDLGGPHKAWKNIPVTDVRVGDIVSDVGLVQGTFTVTSPAVTTLTNVYGEQTLFSNSAVVFAFTE